MKEIKINDTVVARHIQINDIKEGLSFFSNNDEFIQVGTWNYDNNHTLLAHYHNEFDRIITRTNEVLIVLNGAVEANIYTLDGFLIDTIILKNNDVLVLLNCGHGYKILEDNTKVIEVKNGPYYGPDIDRKRL